METTSILGIQYIHVIFAFLFIASTFAIMLLRWMAIYRTHPGEIALILGLIRPLVPVLATSLLVVVGFGFWTAVEMGFPLDETWLIVVYFLVGYILIVGAVAGKYDRHTRELAERLSKREPAIYPAEGLNELTQSDVTSADDSTLRRRLQDPINWTMNLSMFSTLFVIIAMMIFKPGSSLEA